MVATRETLRWGLLASEKETQELAFGDQKNDEGVAP